MKVRENKFMLIEWEEKKTEPNLFLNPTKVKSSHPKTPMSISEGIGNYFSWAQISRQTRRAQSEKKQ